MFSSTDNTVMTVRRYSINSSLTGGSVKETRPDGNLQSDSGWGRLQDAIQHHNDNSTLGSPAGVSGGKASSRHSLQEYVHKNRYAETCGASSPERCYKCLSFSRKKWMNLGCFHLLIYRFRLSLFLLYYLVGESPKISGEAELFMTSIGSICC